MDSGDIVLMMRSKNPDMLVYFFSPFLSNSDSSFLKRERKKLQEVELYIALKRPGFFAVLSNSTMPLAGHSRPGFVMPYQFLQPYTTPLLDFFFLFFSASSLFQKPNPSAQKYIYLHKKDLRQQVISKLSTLRGQNAHGILDCRCSSARCRRQGGCALLTSFVVLLWG